MHCFSVKFELVVGVKLKHWPVCGAPWTQQQYQCPLQDWARTPARHCGMESDINKDTSKSFHRNILNALPSITGVTNSVGFLKTIHYDKSLSINN